MNRIRKYWLKLRAVTTKESLLHQVSEVETYVKKLLEKTHIQSKPINMLMVIPRLLFGYFIFFDVGRQLIGLPVSEIQMMDADTIEIIRKFSPRLLELLPWIERVDYWLQGSFLMAGFTTRLVSIGLLWMVTDTLLSSPMPMLTHFFTLTFFISTCLYSLVLGSGKYGLDRVLIWWVTKRKTKE